LCSGEDLLDSSMYGNQQIASNGGPVIAGTLSQIAAVLLDDSHHQLMSGYEGSTLGVPSKSNTILKEFILGNSKAAYNALKS
jgi:hypothetical protein